MIQAIKKFLFVNSSAKQTIAKNTFWLLVGDIAYKCVQAVLIFSLAFLIGQEQFGVYSYITSLTGTLLFIVDFNLIQTSIRSIHHGFLSPQATIHHSLLLKIFLSIISLCLLILFTLLSPQNNSITELLYVYYGYLFLINIAAYLRSTYRHQEMMQKEALLKIISSGILLIVGCGALLGRATLPTFIFGLGIVGVFDLLATCLFLPRSVFTHLHTHTTFSTTLQLAKYGFPLALSSFLINIYINADQIILGRYGQHAGLGIYNFAYKITFFFALFSSAFFSAIFPKTTTLITEHNKTSLFLTGLHHILKRNSLVIALLIIITYLVQQSGIAALGAFTPALGVLQVLWLYCFLEPIGHWGYTILTSIKKDHINTLFLAITAGINILGNILFIPTYGYMSAARVTVFSYFLYSVLCFFALTTGPTQISKE